MLSSEEKLSLIDLFGRVELDKVSLNGDQKTRYVLVIDNNNDLCVLIRGKNYYKVKNSIYSVWKAISLNKYVEITFRDSTIKPIILENGYYKVVFPFNDN